LALEYLQLLLLLSLVFVSAPSIWQRAMDEILQGLDGVQCVLDDMIITEKGDDEHLKILKMYFKGFQWTNFSSKVGQKLVIIVH
jgi:hypothetical protein